MKVHRYQLRVYEGVLDWTHGGGQAQTRLYIPAQGVIGYRDEKQIDFFDDRPETFQEAQKIINGKISEGDLEGKYLGEIELPDEELMRLVLAGKSFNRAREDLQQTFSSLVKLIEPFERRF